MANITTEQLILQSYRMASIISPNEVPDAEQMSNGFELINEIISTFQMSGLFIPFDKIINFTSTAGVSKYTFTNALLPIAPPGPPPDFPFVQAPEQVVPSDFIVKLDYVNLAFGNVIYPVRIIAKSEYYDNIRISSLQSIPVFCFLERGSTTSSINFYPTPIRAFPMEIKAKVALNYLTRFTTITAVPQYFIKFLRHALARDLLPYYPSSNWTDRSEAEYQRLYKLITAADEWNLSIKTDKTLNYGGPFYALSAAGVLLV